MSDLHPPLKALIGCPKNFRIDFNLLRWYTEALMVRTCPSFQHLLQSLHKVCHNVENHWNHLKTTDFQKEPCSTFSLILKLFLWPVMIPPWPLLIPNHLQHLAQTSLTLGSLSWWGSLTLLGTCLKVPTAPCAFHSPRANHCALIVFPL